MQLAEATDTADTAQPQSLLAVIPHGGGSTAHCHAVVLKDLLDVPLFTEEGVLGRVLADLENGGGRVFVVGILELGEEFGDVGEAGCVDVVFLVYGEVVGGVAGVDDVDEGECVVGLECEDSDVGIGGGGDVEAVRVERGCHYAVRVRVRSGCGDLASADIAESKIGTREEEVQQTARACLDAVVVGEYEAVRSDSSRAVGCSDRFTGVGSDVPHS